MLEIPYHTHQTMNRVKQVGQFNLKQKGYLVLQLLGKVQIGPSTINYVNLGPQLSKSNQFHPLVPFPFKYNGINS